MFNHGSYVCTSVLEVLSERLARSVVNNHGGFTLVCISVVLLSVVASDHGSRVSTCHRGGCVMEFSVERFK